jgi:hypothetical protein
MLGGVPTDMTTISPFPIHYFTFPIPHFLFPYPPFPIPPFTISFSNSHICTRILCVGETFIPLNLPASQGIRFYSFLKIFYSKIRWFLPVNPAPLSITYGNLSNRFL